MSLKIHFYTANMDHTNEVNRNNDQGMSIKIQFEFDDLSRHLDRKILEVITPHCYIASIGNEC